MGSARAAAGAQLLTSQNTPQSSYSPSPLHRHPLLQEVQDTSLCVFSPSHLKQLIDLRLGERDGEGGGEKEETLQFEIPGSGPTCVSGPLNTLLLLVLYIPPSRKKYQRSRNHPTTSPAGPLVRLRALSKGTFPRCPWKVGLSFC